MSSAEEDDLPCLSPLEDSTHSKASKSSHVGISFEQLVKDKQKEDDREVIYKELQEFKLDDTDDEEDEDEDENTKKQEEPELKEVIAYGTNFITGCNTESLPEIIFPEEVLEKLCPSGIKPDLLVLLPWGPLLQQWFEPPCSARYQVWLFGLCCYCQDVEVSKQATYLLLSELEKTPSEDTYTPTHEDICNVFDDYGAVEKPELVHLYQELEVPAYFNNIKNALKVYGTAVREHEADLESTLTVVRLIVRLCQDQHLTSSPDFVEYSNILSNIFDGLGCFTSIEIDRISFMIANEVCSMLVAPALCQVIRSGNPRCHLILEQVTLLILANYAGMSTKNVNKDTDRPQLHHIISKITERSERDKPTPEEFAATCVILDYNITQGVMNKDQLSEVHDAMYKLYGTIKEQQEEKLFSVRTSVLATISCVFKRIRMSEDTMTMFN